MTEAEEYGYDGSYFTSGSAPTPGFAYRDGYISSSPPTKRNRVRMESDTEGEPYSTAAETDGSPVLSPRRLVDNGPPNFDSNRPRINERMMALEEQIAELIVFDYGVLVFLGMEESQERAILEDIHTVSVVLLHPKYIQSTNVTMIGWPGHSSKS